MKTKFSLLSNNWHAFVSYFIFFILLTFPLILKFNTLIIGNLDRMPDLNGTLWFHRLAKDSIVNFNFHNIFHSDLIFYPFGKNVILEMGNILHPLSGILLQVVFGFPAYHNLICLFIFVINGFSMYLLINYFIKNGAVSLFTSLIFALNPFTILQINNGALDEANAFWMIFYMLYLFKLMDEKKVRYALLTTLFFILTSLSYWFYGIFAVFFAIIIITYYAFINWREIFNLSFLKRMLIFILIPFLIFLPILYFYLKNIHLIKGVSWLSDFPSLGKISSRMLPLYYYHIINSSSKLPLLFKLGTYINNFFYLKFALILLPCFTLFRKRAYLWIIVAAFFYILSLGPYLQYSREGSELILKPTTILPGISLPYLFFYKYVPFLSRLRWLERFLLVGSIALTVIYSFSFSWFYKKNKLLALIFLWLGSFLLILDNIPKEKALFQLGTTYVPQYYNALKREQDCAIIELPISYNYQKNLYYQIIHNKKTLGGMGMGERNEFLLPDKWLGFVKNNSFLKFLWDFPYSSSGELKKEDVDILKKLGYKYIVVNPEYFIKPSGSLDGNAYNKTKMALLKLFGKSRDYPDNILVFTLSDLQAYGLSVY